MWPVFGDVWFDSKNLFVWGKVTKLGTKLTTNLKHIEQIVMTKHVWTYNNQVRNTDLKLFGHMKSTLCPNVGIWKSDFLATHATKLEKQLMSKQKRIDWWEQQPSSAIGSER